jgi:hypothetical protein
MFWDPSLHKLIYSDSTIFDKRDFPGTKQAKEIVPDLLPDIQFELLNNQIPADDIPQPPKPLNDGFQFVPPEPEHVEVHTHNDALPNPVPPVLVAGQPVPQPGAPDAPARSPPCPPAHLSRELCSLLDTSNFERRPQNLVPVC